MIDEKKDLPPVTCFLWIVILFAIFVLFAAAAGLGFFLKFAYPALGLLIGGILYFRNPTLYIAYTWWIWFLSPLVRRIVDSQVGWDPLNPITLTPYLVTLLTVVTFIRQFQQLFRSAVLPFGMILTGIGYAYFVGVAKNGVFSASYDLLAWMTPVLFAAHFAYFWQHFPQFRDTVIRTFIWGALVMGLYGVFQFVSPPEWDRYWMENAPIGTLGLPLPFLIKPFSTLNSTGPFANVMLAGLFLTFCGKGLIRFFAAVPGYVSFFLTLIRSVWGGWVVGLAFITVKATGRLRRRLIILFLAMILIVLPLISFGPIAERLSLRFQTLGVIRWDISFAERIRFHSKYMGYAFGNIVGEGLGSTGLATKLTGKVGELGRFSSFDSGTMHIPFVLGWPGAVLYLGGLIMLLFYAFSVKIKKEESFEIVSKAIILAVLSQIIFFNPFTGVVGMIFWSFLGLLLSARQYALEAV